MKTIIAVAAAVALSLPLTHAVTAPAQKAALLAFGKATKSEGYLYDTPGGHWVSSTDPCADWDFVTCDGGGVNVEELALGQANLQGTVPKAVSALTALTGLDLTISTGLRDFSALGSIKSLKLLGMLGLGLKQVPQWLTKLTNLELLSLSTNLAMKGPVPAFLSKLTKLTSLDLSGGKLTGKLPVGFSKLTNLVELGLVVNKLTGNIPSQYSTLKNLESFQLTNNKLSGPIPAALTALDVANGGSLTQLEICGNSPTFVAPAGFTAGVVGVCD